MYVRYKPAFILSKNSLVYLPLIIKECRQIPSLLRLVLIELFAKLCVRISGSHGLIRHCFTLDVRLFDLPLAYRRKSIVGSITGLEKKIPRSLMYM